MKKYILLALIVFVTSCTGKYLVYESKTDCIYDYTVYYEGGYSCISIYFNHPFIIDVKQVFLRRKEIKNVVNNGDLKYQIYFYTDDRLTMTQITEECILDINQILEKRCITP